MKRRQPIALFTLLAFGLLALLVPGQWVRDPAPSAAAGVETGGPISHSGSRTADAAANLDGILPGLKKLNAERHSLVGSGGARALSAPGPWNAIAFDVLPVVWPIASIGARAGASFGGEGATGPPTAVRA